MRHVVAVTICVLLLALALNAQEPDNTTSPRIVVLVWHESPNDLAALRGLKRGLAVAGLGRRIEELQAREDEARARRLIAAAKKSGCDLFVALGTRATQICMAEIKDCPLLFTAVTNPVLAGITPSWSGSGTNVAGNSNWLDRRAMLTSFRRAQPGMKKLCVLRSAGNAVSEAEAKEAATAIGALKGATLVDEVLNTGASLEAKLDDILPRIDALWLPIDFKLYQAVPLKMIMAKAKVAKVPVFSSTAKCAGLGAVVVMTVDYVALGMKAASIARRILVQKEKPGDIPIGRLSSSRLFVDIKAAQEVGLKLPMELLFRAHRILAKESGK